MTAHRDRAWLVVAMLEAILLAVLLVDLMGAERGDATWEEPSDPSIETRRVEPARQAHVEASDLERSDPSGSVGERETVAPSAEPPISDAGTIALLCGRVTDLEGAPLSARLTLMPPEDVSSERLVTHRIAPSGDGYYAIPGIEPGAYRLEVVADEHRSETLAFEVPAERDLVTLDVVLERTWKLRVKVRTPAGRWFDDAIADWRAEHASPMSRVLSVVAAEDPLPQRLPDPGGFSITRLGLGRWEVSNRWFGGVPLPEGYIGVLELPERMPLHVGLVFQGAVLASEQVAGGQEELEFEVDDSAFRAQLGSVRMRIVDGATGEPCSGVSVQLRDSQRLEGKAESAADGSVVVRGLGPARYVLSVGAAGGLRADRWEIEPVAGVELDLGDVALHVPVAVSLEFEGPEADAEVYVTLSSADPPSHPALHPRSITTTRRNGAAEVRLAPGRWTAHARCAGWRCIVRFDTADLGGRPLQIRMQSTARLRITPPDDGRRLRLRILDEAGTSFLDWWFNSDATMDFGLPPGRYSVVTANLQGEETTRSLTVREEGGTLDLRDAR